MMLWQQIVPGVVPWSLAVHVALKPAAGIRLEGDTGCRWPDQDCGSCLSVVAGLELSRCFVLNAPCQGLAKTVMAWGPWHFTSFKALAPGRDSAGASDGLAFQLLQCTSVHPCQAGMHLTKLGQLRMTMPAVGGPH